MGKVLLVTLVFEAVVFALAIVGMIQVSSLPVGTALAVGGGATALAFVAAATLRGPLGYPLGWLTQAAALVLGFATPWMFLMGGVFVLLWVVSFVLGRRLDRSAATG